MLKISRLATGNKIFICCKIHFLIPEYSTYFFDLQYHAKGKQQNRTENPIYPSGYLL